MEIIYFVWIDSGIYLIILKMDCIMKEIMYTVDIIDLRRRMVGLFTNFMLYEVVDNII